MMPEEVAWGGQAGIAAFDNEWTLENGDGHIAVDYPKLLRVGLDGVSAEVKEKLSVLDLSEPDNLPRYYFYRSLLIIDLR